ncbi:MAG: lysozyme inhibitor LprI family protein [Neisseria sp.]|nr:lysozyme inhibitor LprI family protein [Neisseria sp.]
MPHAKTLMPVLLAAFALTACQPETPQHASSLQCGNPAVTEQMQNSLNQALKEQTRMFAAQDARGFVDVQKINAAIGEIAVTLNGAEQIGQGGNAYCQGEISIAIPENILSTASLNAPLLYGENSLSHTIHQRISGSTLRYNENGIFSQTLQYTPKTAENGEISLFYQGDGLSAAYNALISALLPYGIKDFLVIDGKTVSREEALKTDNERGIEPAEETNAENEVSEEISEEASTEFASLSATEETEILTPSENRSEVPFNDSDVVHARADNRDAQTDITLLWKKLDKTVQQELLDEQRNWIEEKNGHCRQAAAQAESSAQAEYQRLQCDTRMTRERIQYLRGYSLP